VYETTPLFYREYIKILILMYPVLTIVLIYISLQKFIYIILPALNSNPSKKKGVETWIIL